MTALVPRKRILMWSCPYSEAPLQSECSDWSPLALSLHQGCPYIECPYKEKLQREEAIHSLKDNAVTFVHLFTLFACLLGPWSPAVELGTCCHYKSDVACMYACRKCYRHELMLMQSKFMRDLFSALKCNAPPICRVCQSIVWIN